MTILFILLFGMIIGSFLNVCIYRIPKETSIVFPGSHCTNCNHSLGYMDLIPVISFLILKGKCRYCGHKIASRYMLIELLTGVLFGIVYLKFGLSIETIMYAVFAAVLVTLTMIDIDHMLLPTKIIMFGVGVGIVFRVMQAVIYQDMMLVGSAVLAAGLGYGLFGMLFYGAKLLLKKEGLGFGDVRLMGMLGLYLSVNLLFFTMFIASLLASFYGIVLFYRKKASEPFPFGPFLNIAALLALFYGDRIIGWYLGFIGF
ncbi:prepilin peptidase [Cellulosilyticum sp. I15G10I2]|uniref:prepilin peptidase n=1 Tax=Cellulosilyticum sp. I15G10I2 TaxID=1892843 RepID=UPI00085BB121|nr:A24 family peptidase [Cellulosilyticum sp. I15G10I2]